MHRNSATAESSTLYVVATPLGNLRDITLRALDILGSVDWVAAEDTRLSVRLLQHYGLKPKLLALHEHNERSAAEKVLQLLRDGASVAVVSDAGTPAISDPGALLVAAARAAGYRVVPLPGPSAVIAALSVAGFAVTPYLFFGFLPARAAARREALAELSNATCALVFYEAPHRVKATLADLASCFGSERRIMIARELTKVFESVHVCALGEAVAWLEADANRMRGEFVLGLEATGESASPAAAVDLTAVLTPLLAELSLKQAVQLATRITGQPRNAVYDRALALKREQ